MVDEVLRDTGNILRTLSLHHYIITIGSSPQQEYISALFSSMGLEYHFFDMCSEENLQIPLVSRMVGFFNRKIQNTNLREFLFERTKCERTATLITYYMLWTHCMYKHPAEPVAIWEDSVIINSSLTHEAFGDIIKDFARNLPQYDLLLLGQFPQQFKTSYHDDGKSRWKCSVPINGYTHISEHLLQLTYSFPSGASIYSPRCIDKMLDEVESMLESGNAIYPLECFIADRMASLSTYCVNPPLFGQMLDKDSVILN